MAVDEREKSRRLRLLESAAASAIANGASVDEVNAAVQAGVDEELASPLHGFADRIAAEHAARAAHALSGSASR